jgi:hypothetical protein
MIILDLHKLKYWKDNSIEGSIVVVKEGNAVIVN